MARPSPPISKTDKRLIRIVRYLKALQAEHGHLWDEDGVDIRLQILNDNYIMHFGPSDYDTDHNGYWAASSLMAHSTEAEMTDIAYNLILEALEDQHTDSQE